MKVKLTKMPARIKGKRYEVGDIVDVDKDLYETMKSICIVYDVETKNKTKKVKKTEDKKVENKEPDRYSTMTKESIMLELSKLEVAFNPSATKKELYEELLKHE